TRHRARTHPGSPVTGSMAAIDPGIRIRTAFSLPWTRTETACRYDAPETASVTCAAGSNPPGHRKLPLLGGRARDPVEPEGTYLAAARVESGGIPPSPEGDNAVRLENPFGGPVVFVAVGDGGRPAPDSGLGDGEQHPRLGGRRSAALICVRGGRHEGVEPGGERDPDGGLVNLFTPITPEAKAKYGL